LPENFIVSAYPNPFNAATTISYILPKSTCVTLEIYNILGGRLETLVDTNQPAGHYQITWNASDLSTGVYFYRIQTDDAVQTQKLVLLK